MGARLRFMRPAARTHRAPFHDVLLGASNRTPTQRTTGETQRSRRSESGWRTLLGQRSQSPKNEGYG